MRPNRQETYRGLMELYNEESSKYLQKRPWMRSYIFMDMNRTILRFLKIILEEQNDTIRILNVGCGPGWIENSLAPLVKGFSQDVLFVSVDVAVEMAKITKKQVPYVEAIVAEGTNLPFQSDSFCVAISSRAIKFMKLSSLLNCMKTVLRRDGFFLAIFDCSDAFWVRFLERWGFPIDAGINRRTLRTKELMSVLSKLGFSILGSSPVTGLPLSMLSQVPRSVDVFLKRLDVPRVIGARINIICARNESRDRPALVKKANSKI